MSSAVITADGRYNGYEMGWINRDNGMALYFLVLGGNKFTSEQNEICACQKIIESVEGGGSNSSDLVRS